MMRQLPEQLQAASAQVGVALGPEAVVRLGRFLGVLMTWNSRLRLVGERDPEAIVQRHVADSLAPLAVVPEKGLVVDLGSGAGFPGIVLACARPDQEYVLVDSRRRRVSFLRDVVRTIPLPRVRIVEGRAETLGSSAGLARQATVVIARALRIDVFLALAQVFLAPSGRVVAMQTPAAKNRANAVASAARLRLERALDYRLADGTPRSLLVFVRASERSQT